MLLIPRIGVIGAGIAQCVSTLVSNTLNGLAARRWFGDFAIGRHHLSLLVAALAASGAMLLAGKISITNKYAGLAAIVGATLTIYTATLFLIGIVPEDKQIIRILLMPGKWRKAKPDEKLEA